MDKYDLDSEASRACLLQMYRHAQVGGCVSGVAHDINNLLGAAMAYAELASYDEGISEESSKMLMQVVDGISKCSKLVTSLTSISRKDRVDISLASPDQLMEEVLVLRDYELKLRHIKVSRDYHSDVAAVSVDMAKLKLALLFIMLNAEKAVERAGVKTIKVTISKGDDGVNFDVLDSGGGIEPGAEEKIFEPFYSGWGDAGYMGLGLHSAQRIAELHGGSVSYSPEHGFRLFVRRDNGLEDSR